MTPPRTGPTDPRFGLVLAIGATGMLAGALEHLTRSARTTLVVARSATRSVEELRLERALPLDLDWRDPVAFADGIETAIAGRPVDAALVWIHRSGAAAWDRLLPRLAEEACLLVHVQGSASLDPAAFGPALPTDGSVPYRYRTVRLGAHAGAGGHRWLRHDEIAAGATRALDREEDVVVGTLPTPHGRGDPS